MRHLLEALPPALWRAYAAAREEHDRTGAWPASGRINGLALQHDACPWALLVLTRGELPELDGERRLTGELVSIRDHARTLGRPLVLAPTPDALLALQLTAADVYADVVDPWQRAVEPRELERAAREWAQAAHDGARSLAPVRVAAPALPLEPEH